MNPSDDQKPMNDEKKCPQCGAHYEEGSKFCGYCGKSLVMVCKRCGRKFAPEIRFCTECGIALVEAKSPEAEADGVSGNSQDTESPDETLPSAPTTQLQSENSEELEIKFMCSRCGQKLSAPVDMERKSCTCPVCGTSMMIPSGANVKLRATTKKVTQKVLVVAKDILIATFRWGKRTVVAVWKSGRTGKSVICIGVVLAILLILMKCGGCDGSSLSGVKEAIGKAMRVIRGENDPDAENTGKEDREIFPVKSFPGVFLEKPAQNE